MSMVIKRTEQSLATVNQAVRALENGDASRGYQLFSEVKRGGTLIIKETQNLLDRVSAVEMYYREMEDDKSRRINELYHSEQVKEQEKKEKSAAKRSKKSNLQQAEQDLSAAEDGKRRATRQKEEAESSKIANIAGAAFLGAATLASFGILSPITAPGAIACSVNAVIASGNEDRAERDIIHARDKISRYEMEIMQYRREIQKLDSELTTLSQEIAQAKSERDSIHIQRGEVTESIMYLRDVLNFWREFSQLTEHGTHRATLLERLSALLRVHDNYTRPPQLQSCTNAWSKIEKMLEKGTEHVFSIDFTCHYCHKSFQELPHINNRKFCCISCINI